MKYIVYKITNIINGKIYIGVHKTNNTEDGYMGSGVNIKRAINKYGIENFKKEYIAIFDNPEEMFKMESELVNEEFIKDNNTYNILKGGLGSFNYINEVYWNADNYEERIKNCSKAGSWERPKIEKIKNYKPLSPEEKFKIGKQMGDKYGGQNKLSLNDIDDRLNKISDIDLIKYGWVKKVSERLGISHAQVRRFIDKHYIGEIYKRN